MIDHPNVRFGSFAEVRASLGEVLSFPASGLRKGGLSGQFRANKRHATVES